MNLFQYFLKTHCLFHRLTGLYCPGCGGKRAVYLLFHGHPLLSLWYHPLVVYTLFVLVYYLFCFLKKKLLHPSVKKPLPSWPLWGALILLFANCLLKNALLIFFHIEPLSSHIF